MFGLHRVFRPRWIGALVLVAAAAGGGVAWTNTRSKAAVVAPPILGTVTAGTIRQTVSATGTFRPAREADLNFAVAGSITSVRIAVGDTVRKGQRLATVDNTALKADVLSAASALTAAQARLTADTAAAGAAVQISADNASVAAAKNQLAQSNRSLAAAALTSPIPGRVSSVSIAVGDSVTGNGSGSAASAGSGTSGGGTTAQIVVIATDAFVVNANVGSADVPSLKKGLQAQMIPTGTSTPVFGTVSSVGFVAAAGTTTSTTTFPVVIAVTGKPEGLLVGGTASVSITVKQLDGVLTIPVAALSTVNGQTVVHQLKNGKQVDTSVTVGATYGAQTEIVAGLTEGDQYVLPAGTTARTGQTRRQGTGGGIGGQGGQGGQGGFGGGNRGQGGQGAPAGGPVVIAP